MRHIFLLFFIIPLLLLSHGGRTDSRGGHNDNINGGYHYHHGCSAHSHSGGCPYDYENCTNAGSRGSYKSKSNEYILWYIIGGFVLFIFVVYLYGEYISYREKNREKKRILKEQRLEKDKRHKTFLYLKRKQYNQNDEHISNQLSADQTLKFNELKDEFEPKPKPKVKIELKPQKKIGKKLLSWQKIDNALNLIISFLDFEWLKYKWARIFLRIIFYPLYFWLFLILLILIFAAVALPFELIFK